MRMNNNLTTGSSKCSFLTDSYENTLYPESMSFHFLSSLDFAVIRTPMTVLHSLLLSCSVRFVRSLCRRFQRSNSDSGPELGSMNLEITWIEHGNHVNCDTINSLGARSRKTNSISQWKLSNFYNFLASGKHSDINIRWIIQQLDVEVSPPANDSVLHLAQLTTLLEIRWPCHWPMTLTCTLDLNNYFVCRHSIHTKSNGFWDMNYFPVLVID